MIKFLDLQKINESFEPALSKAVSDVVNSGWYLQGEQNGLFEKEYSEYIGTQYAVGCGNGLDALILILKAYIELGVFRKGDEIIVPANTYIATILAITEAGLTPVLVEPEKDNYQIGITGIKNALTCRTVAVMIVHLYGCCAYTPEIDIFCKEHGLKLIEDNAQAHGCRFADKRTGALGDAAGNSFYPGKNLGALGDGGMVTTNDKSLAAMVRRLGNYGSGEKYIFDSLGKNSRLDELQAAVLRVKLPRLDHDNARRREIATMYQRGIKNKMIRLPNAFVKMGESCVYHVYPVMCDDRDELKNHLEKNGVQTIIHYPVPPYRQKCYENKNMLKLPSSLKITDKIHRNELSLPISPVMTDEEVHCVINAVNSFKK